MENKKSKNFWGDLKKLPVFVNKKNGQHSVNLPKKGVKKMPKFVYYDTKKDKIVWGK